MASTINAKNTSSGLVLTPDSSGQLELQTADTTRMTIDVNGNVGIGTSSPSASYKLTVNQNDGGIAITAPSTKYALLSIAGNGNTLASTSFDILQDSTTAYIYNRANTPMVFATNSTERMRIDSSGNVLVGRTSTGFDKTAYGWQISRDAESFVTVNTSPSCITFNRNNNGDIFKFFRDGTQRGWISVETTGTTFGNLSDRRVKENFADAPEALSKINNVNVQSFDWKEGGHTDYGFVAQDLNTVLPFAVTVGDDGEEVEKAWGVDNTKIVPVLVKAIQELKAIVDTQAERIAVLENKIV